MKTIITFLSITLFTINHLCAQKFLIIVEQSLKSSINASLTIYQNDLINEGYSPIVVTFSGSDFTALRSSLERQSQYLQH